MGGLAPEPESQTPTVAEGIVQMRAEALLALARRVRKQLAQET